MKKNKFLKPFSGFSLIEILLVLAGIGFLVILIATLPNSINLVTQSRNESLAREIAVNEIESTRESLYANLAEGTQQINDQRIALLPGGSGEKTVAACDPAICTKSELVKKVTVNISWTHDGKKKEIKLTTFISKGGLNQ